jgi:hypothetical protein
MTDESLIRERAYALWEHDGRPAAADLACWYLAQQQLEHESHAFETDTGDLIPATGTGISGKIESSSDTRQGGQGKSGNRGKQKPVTVPGQGAVAEPLDTDQPAKSDDGPLGDA